MIIGREGLVRALSLPTEIRDRSRLFWDRARAWFFDNVCSMYGRRWMGRARVIRIYCRRAACRVFLMLESRGWITSVTCARVVEKYWSVVN